MSRLQLLARIKQHRFLKFLVVGGINTLFGFITYSALAFSDLSTFIVLLISTFVGISFNIFTTGGLVFRDLSFHRIPRFIIIAIVIFLSNLELIKCLSPLYVGRIEAMAIIIVPMTILNYFLLVWFVYKD
jgi:putative flippase GtrA